jgi:hypothetical protein
MKKIIALLKNALLYMAVGVFFIVGAAIMVIAFMYYMDSFGTRVVHIPGRGFVEVEKCEREGWCKPGKPEPKLFGWLFKRDEPPPKERAAPSYDWLCPYVTTCDADSVYTWDNEDGIVFGKMTTARRNDDDPYFEEEP